MAPGQLAVRLGLVALAVAFAGAVPASLSGLGPRPPSVAAGSLATATVALLAALLPSPSPGVVPPHPLRSTYGARALLAVVAGLVPLALGALGEGPLGAIGFEGTARAAAGLLFVTLLPGALFFRARYRAFRAARVILGIAIVLAAPTMVWLGTGAFTDGDLTERILDGVTLAASLTAFCGFMGEETTGGCTGWGLLVILAHAARLAARSFGEDGELFGPWGFAIGAAGEFIAATLIALAIFQLFAAVFAREARKVDVHRIVGPGAEDREPLASITTE